MPAKVVVYDLLPLFGRFKVDDSGMSLDTEPSRHLGEEEQETQR